MLSLVSSVISAEPEPYAVSVRCPCTLGTEGQSGGGGVGCGKGDHKTVMPRCPLNPGRGQSCLGTHMAYWGFYQMLTIQGSKTNCTGSRHTRGSRDPPALLAALPQSFPHRPIPSCAPPYPVPPSTPPPHPPTLPLYPTPMLRGHSTSAWEEPPAPVLLTDCSAVHPYPHQEAPWVSTFLSALGLAMDRGRYQGRAGLPREVGWGG